MESFACWRRIVNARTHRLFSTVVIHTEFVLCRGPFQRSFRSCVCVRVSCCSRTCHHPPPFVLPYHLTQQTKCFKIFGGRINEPFHDPGGARSTQHVSPSQVAQTTWLDSFACCFIKVSQNLSSKFRLPQRQVKRSETQVVLLKPRTHSQT